MGGTCRWRIYEPGKLIMPLRGRVPAKQSGDRGCALAPSAHLSRLPAAPGHSRPWQTTFRYVSESRCPAATALTRYS
jgi:hypothetical protein